MKSLFSASVTAAICCGLFFPAACRQPQSREAKAAAGKFAEDFEHGGKRAYAAAEATLSSGTWLLDGALLGSSESDRRIGNTALRIAANGHADMQFDLEQVPDTVSLRYGPYGKDGDVRLSLWYSNDHGRKWKPLSRNNSPAGDGLSGMEVTLTSGYDAPIRFRLQNDGPGRINVDDFGSGRYRHTPPSTTPTIGDTGAAAASGASPHLLLGNPSNAKADASSDANYLLVHPQYAMSYNSARGTANWVSWHLSRAEQGNAPRCNCFMADASLPEGYYRVQSSNYIGTGFDRGHICPSDDRSGSATDNAATFLMPNIAPQAPDLNQKSWKLLEEYARRLSDAGKELYVISGCYGEGGTGSKGRATHIANGRITVPAHFWKILLVLPEGDNDLRRIDGRSEVIAVDMPNTQDAGAQSWQSFRCKVSDLEMATGCRFFTALPASVAQALKGR